MLLFFPVEKLTASTLWKRILFLDSRQSSFRRIRPRTCRLIEADEVTQDQQPSKRFKPSMHSLEYLGIITLQ